MSRANIEFNRMAHEICHGTGVGMIDLWGSIHYILAWVNTSDLWLVTSPGFDICHTARQFDAVMMVMSRCGWLMVPAPKSWTSTWGLWWMPAFRQMVPESSLWLRCTVEKSLPVPSTRLGNWPWEWYAVILLNRGSSKIIKMTSHQKSQALIFVKQT